MAGPHTAWPLLGTFPQTFCPQMHGAPVDPHQFSGSGVRRQVDVSTQHGRPGDAFSNAVCGQHHSAIMLVVMAANRYELLASWYLRFNGYFTTPNFIVHKDYRKRPGGTDADILAVRFPCSTEFQLRFKFECDPRLVVYQDKIDFL